MKLGEGGAVLRLFKVGTCLVASSDVHQEEIGEEHHVTQ